MRVCCQCGTPDHEIIRTGAESVHFVVPEIRYMDKIEDITPRLRAKGWAPKLFQGRQAMVRLICVNCLNENKTRDQIWGELKANARQLEKKSDEYAEFYQLLVA